METKRVDSFKARRTLKVGNKSYEYFSLKAAESAGAGQGSRLTILLPKAPGI